MKFVWQLQNMVVPDPGEHWCRHSPQDTTKETIDTRCAAQSVSYLEMWPKNGLYLYIKQVVMRTSGITAMPRSILRISIWIFLPRVWTAYAHKWKNLPILIFFFQTTYGHFRIFSHHSSRWPPPTSGWAEVHQDRRGSTVVIRAPPL